MEAIRIIREMRCATNGKYPKIVLFENVVGLLSSGSGSDYRTALEAFTESEIPMPESGCWANAGLVRGRGIDLAWVVKDAQHHRTAQRRRRLFVVVDFTGQRAGEILFESSCLSGYFAAREREGQGTSVHAENGVGGAGERNGELNQVPCLCEPQIARTLTARGDSSPCADRGQNIIAIHQNQQGDVHTADVAYTLNTNSNVSGRNAPLVAHPIAVVDCRNFVETDEISGTLQSKCTGGYSLNFMNPVRTGYIVRRLTPTECERLMSLPDGWTEYGHDGKRMSDSARYSMCGNSIVVNVLTYIMQNITVCLRKGDGYV